MNLRILLLCCLCPIASPAQKPMQYVPTKASISGVASVPGRTGAAPGARPMVNAAFKLVEGTSYKGQLPVSTFTTDDEGNFYLELPPGSYAIVEGERPESFIPRKNTATESWDNSCLKKQWQSPLLIVRVGSTAAQKIRLEKLPPDEKNCLKKTAHHGK